MTVDPWRPVLTVLAVGLGLAGGLGLHQVLVGAPDGEWVATMTVTVRQARMGATGPVADLDVRLLTSGTAVEIVAARTSGRGIAQPDRLVKLTPTPGIGRDADESPRLLRRRLTVPLACAGDPAPTATQPSTEPAQLTLALRTGSGARHEVTSTIPSGSPAMVDLCSQTVGMLPPGWGHSVTAAAFAVDPARPRTARLRVTGVPTGFVGVSTTEPQPQPLQLRVLDGDPDAGTLTLQLLASAACDDYLGPPPVGLSVSVTDRSGDSTDHYVAVGAPLARWLLTEGFGHCDPGPPVPTAPTPSPLYRVSP